jgi:hypothetical protein
MANAQTPRARRTLPLVFNAFAISIAGAFASIALAPAAAASPHSAGYSVALATPLAAPKREILNGVIWRCEGDQCAGAADGSRPVLACQRVASAFGTVARFSGPKGDLGADDLARCNAR